MGYPARTDGPLHRTAPPHSILQALLHWCVLCRTDRVLAGRRSTSSTCTSWTWCKWPSRLGSLSRPRSTWRWRPPRPAAARTAAAERQVAPWPGNRPRGTRLARQTRMARRRQATPGSSPIDDGRLGPRVNRPLFCNCVLNYEFHKVRTSHRNFTGTSDLVSTPHQAHLTSWTGCLCPHKLDALPSCQATMSIMNGPIGSLSSSPLSEPIAGAAT